ncbi:MAG: hypothetical protein K2G07_07600 [Muribaculaceae bacterium]|nr:hypothetical protein [Muribaculaceae bacterium]
MVDYYFNRPFTDFKRNFHSHKAKGLAAISLERLKGLPRYLSTLNPWPLQRLGVFFVNVLGGGCWPSAL